MRAAPPPFRTGSETAFVLGAVLLLLGTGGCAPLSGVLRTGAGTAAHNLCSSTFVSGLPEPQTRDELVGALLGRARALLRYRIDRPDGRVRATLLGARAEAVFTPGYGCRLVYPGGREAALPPVALSPPPAADAFAPLEPVRAADPALNAALDEVFGETPGQPPRRVKAVVIVKDGRVVAERYAPGVGVDTPLLSFSVAKSVTNAMLGVLVRQGRLKMTAPAAVPEWRGAGDPRGRITADDLLRMASGLVAAETDTGFDPASQMLYGQDDMASFAAGHPLARAPGSVWAYTSANTLILDRMIGDQVGGGPAGLRQFAQDQIFGPLGMTNVTLEFDGAGTFVGAAHVYAPARAFARFGQLYLDDGVAPDGRRILPKGWVAYSRRSTLGSTYGAGFWTNDGPSREAAWRVARGFPKDGFFASGNLGQRIYIAPSQRLVIARFGYSQGADFGMAADLRLMTAAMAAFRSAPAAR